MRLGALKLINNVPFSHSSGGYANARRLASCVSATLLFAPMSVLPASAAETATICDSPSDGWWSMTSVSQAYEVTHASRYENYTNSNQTLTKTAGFQRQLTAGATTTSSAAGTFSTNTLIEQLEATATVTVSLQMAGAVTSTSTQSVTTTLQHGGVTVVFAGARKASGNWAYNYCNSSGLLRTSYGTVRSWDVLVEGGVFCANNPPSSTLAYQAKRLYC